MSVHYKFKSALEFDTVTFDGLHISVGDLKKAILHQKKLSKTVDFDLQVTNAQTKEVYTDEGALIAKNTSLIVARIPLSAQQKRTWNRENAASQLVAKAGEQQSASSDNQDGGHSRLAKAVDLSSLDASEDDKIRAMMSQSTYEYDPTNYMRIRGSNQVGEVPAAYRCFKCQMSGHWIKNCPLIQNSGEPLEIKKSTGIPRSFMVPVDGPLVPGAMMTPLGNFAVPAIDHEAYKEQKKEKPPFQGEGATVESKPELPEDLVCSVCEDLLTDAVMIPCCGNSFCDECIRGVLLDSDEHECPDCKEKDVSPDTLIPNRFLRNAVNNFRNETGYLKPSKASVQPIQPPPVPVVVASVVPPAIQPVSKPVEQTPEKKTDKKPVSDSKQEAPSAIPSLISVVGSSPPAKLHPPGASPPYSGHGSHQGRTSSHPEPPRHSTQRSSSSRTQTSSRSERESRPSKEYSQPRREERSDTPTHDEPPSGPPRLPDTSVPPPNFGSSGPLAPPGVDDAYLGPRPTGAVLPPTHVPPPALDYRRIESVVPPTRYPLMQGDLPAQYTSRNYSSRGGPPYDHNNSGYHPGGRGYRGRSSRGGMQTGGGRGMMGAATRLDQPPPQTYPPTPLFPPPPSEEQTEVHGGGSRYRDGPMHNGSQTAIDPLEAFTRMLQEKEERDRKLRRSRRTRSYSRSPPPRRGSPRRGSPRDSYSPRSPRSPRSRTPRSPRSLRSRSPRPPRSPRLVRSPQRPARSPLQQRSRTRSRTRSRSRSNSRSFSLSSRSPSPREYSPRRQKMATPPPRYRHIASRSPPPHRFGYKEPRGADFGQYYEPEFYAGRAPRFPPRKEERERDFFPAPPVETYRYQQSQSAPQTDRFDRPPRNDRPDRFDNRDRNQGSYRGRYDNFHQNRADNVDRFDKAHDRYEPRTYEKNYDRYEDRENYDKPPVEPREFKEPILEPPDAYYDENVLVSNVPVFHKKRDNQPPSLLQISTSMPPILNKMTSSLEQDLVRDRPSSGERLSSRETRGNRERPTSRDGPASLIRERPSSREDLVRDKRERHLSHEKRHRRDVPRSRTPKKTAVVKEKEVALAPEREKKHETPTPVEDEKVKEGKKIKTKKNKRRTSDADKSKKKKHKEKEKVQHSNKSGEKKKGHKTTTKTSKIEEVKKKREVKVVSEVKKEVTEPSEVPDETKTVVSAEPDTTVPAEAVAEVTEGVAENEPAAGPEGVQAEVTATTMDTSGVENVKQETPEQKPEPEEPAAAPAAEEETETAPEEEEADLSKEADLKEPELLVPLPEPSRWEREDMPEPSKWEKSEEGETSQSSTPGPTAAAAASAEKDQVTSEVLKRAENAIFKKAINAIRPERKKRRSERKVFVEKKEGEKSTTTKPTSESDEAAPEPNKVTIQVTVPLLRETEPASEPLSPDSVAPVVPPLMAEEIEKPRSVRDRLGQRVEGRGRTERGRHEARRGAAKGHSDKFSPQRSLPPTAPSRRREHGSSHHDPRFVDNRPPRGEGRRHHHSPEPVRPERRVEMTEVRHQHSPESRPERRVLLAEKRKAETEPASKLARKVEVLEPKRSKLEKASKHKEKEKRKARTKSTDSKKGKKKEKKHRKEKKHKKISKEPEEKSGSGDETKVEEKVEEETGKKKARLSTDRRKSTLDEAQFEPDYDALSPAESEEEVKDPSGEEAKPETTNGKEVVEKPEEKKSKRAAKRKESSSSVEESESSSEESSESSSSSSSESSEASRKRSKRKKHRKTAKKHRKRRVSSSSESESESSSESEREKRTKKKKHRSKKKKSKHHR